MTKEREIILGNIVVAMTIPILGALGGREAIPKKVRLKRKLQVDNVRGRQAKVVTAKEETEERETRECSGLILGQATVGSGIAMRCLHLSCSIWKRSKLPVFQGLPSTNLFQELESDDASENEKFVSILESHHGPRVSCRCQKPNNGKPASTDKKVNTLECISGG